jgi:hypothetical protein
MGKPGNTFVQENPLVLAWLDGRTDRYEACIVDGPSELMSALSGIEISGDKFILAADLLGEVVVTDTDDITKLIPGPRGGQACSQEKRAR